MSLGFSEILLILVVVLLLFGAKRLPEIARSLGRASSEFKRAKESFMQEMEDAASPAEKPASAEPEKFLAGNAETPEPVDPAAVPDPELPPEPAPAAADAADGRKEV